MNEFIADYDKILKANGYVHIATDDLRIQSRISLLLPKYNENQKREKKITKKMTFSQQYKMLKKGEKESPFRNELLKLYSIKQEFDKVPLSEGKLNKRRIYICDVLQENNKNRNLKICFNDIICDLNTVKLEKIESLDQFSKKLKQKDFLSNKYYRGQQNINWIIQPSIYRGKWIEHEKDFIEEMLINNPQDFENSKTTLEKLAKMQHYNAPTRLLDITSNPYIALYFACEKNKDLEKTYGEVVFITNNGEGDKYFDSDAVSIVSNLAMMNNDFSIAKKFSSPEDFCQQGDIPYLLHQIKNEKSHFLDLINPQDLHSCFIVHVQLNNKRIINQQGLFLLVGMGEKKQLPADIENYLYKDNDGKKLVFIIPYKNKNGILDQLSSMGINKKFIYPEIDDVADYLKTEKFLQ